MGHPRPITIEAVLALLPPEHRAVVLSALPAPPSWRRRRQRDELLREGALRFHAGQSVRQAAREIFKCLERAGTAAAGAMKPSAATTLPVKGLHAPCRPPAGPGEPVRRGDAEREWCFRLLEVTGGRVPSQETIRRAITGSSFL
jgi:hypothetical protein